MKPDTYEYQIVLKKQHLFELIEEYLQLRKQHYTIKFIGNKDEFHLAFKILLESEENFGSKLSTNYDVNYLTKKKLDDNKIKYEIITK